MAKQGYFAPRRGPVQARGAAAPSKARPPMGKKADPYTMDQRRDNPDVTDYDRSPEALEHEMPDTRTEWRKDERSPVGLPAPAKGASGNAEARPRLNPKEARRIEAHASRALRVARSVVPEIAFKRLSQASRQDLLLRMGEDLMTMGDLPLQRVLARLDHLRNFAASFSKKALDPVAPTEPMDAPAEDLMEGGPSAEAPMGDELPAEEMGEASGLDPEVEAYIDEAVEEKVEEALGECPSAGAESDGMDLPMGEDEDMPSDEELLGILDEPKASSRREARDPQHWEKSVKDVETPSGDYHSQEADYYEPGSNSEKFEEQMDLSNPAMDKGATRKPQARQKTPAPRRAPAPQKAAAPQTRKPVGPRTLQADGETSVSDPGGLNPWDENEDYHDADSHSYEESPMSEKFEDQMDLSNPVVDKGGRHPKESAAEVDPFLQMIYADSLRSHGVPVDDGCEVDASIVGSATGTSARGAEAGPTHLAEFVTARREIDPSNTMQGESAGVTRVASAPAPRRQAPPARRPANSGRPMRRQAAPAPAPQKAGVRSVGNLGRKASAPSGRSEIDALSALWSSKPDVSKVFG